jgi:hypothetical protein
VILHTDELMQVEFAFEAKAASARFALASARAGELRRRRHVRGDDRRRTETIGAGGSYIVPSGLVHGVKALTPGRSDRLPSPREDVRARISSST